MHINANKILASSRNCNTGYSKCLSVSMKIAYYMPFKPLGHQNPSGDLIIGTELFEFLQKKGADIRLASKFRCRWIYLKPHIWPLFLIEVIKVILSCRRDRPDIWITYHTYYKAPDIIGPLCCRVLNIPYVIFQGIYSTKRRRSVKTWAGFYLNRFALQMAACTFTNKKIDKKNLERILQPDRVQHIPPGLHPDDFQFAQNARERMRNELQVGDQVMIMTAAMFRPGVKTKGITEVITSCSTLAKKGYRVLLVIAGDGANRKQLELRAYSTLGKNVVFLGKLKREEMSEYYSAADVFAFPGIEESLGMVYLEAQACRLPVVAYSDWGAKEVVVNSKTGYLGSAADESSFVSSLEQLIANDVLRQNMGKAAAQHVRKHHNLESNYERIWKRLKEIITVNMH